MNIENIDTKEDLIGFILKGCGNMTYDMYDYSVQHFADDKKMIDLCIDSNFDIRLVHHLITLLRTKFDIKVNELIISDENVTEIEDGYLEYLKIKVLQIPNSINELPTLPYTLVELNLEENNKGWKIEESNYSDIYLLYRFNSTIGDYEKMLDFDEKIDLLRWLQTHFRY